MCGGSTGPSDQRRKVEAAGESGEEGKGVERETKSQLLLEDIRERVPTPFKVGPSDQPT